MSEQTTRLHYRSLYLPPSGSTVELLSHSPTLLIPCHQLVRNSCSMCATKGGLWMSTTICGVLLLDPSPYSPLELVKSVGDVHGSRDSIQRILSGYDRRGTLGVNSSR
jgi:hypothetical protein